VLARYLTPGGGAPRCSKQTSAHPVALLATYIACTLPNRLIGHKTGVVTTAPWGEALSHFPGNNPMHQGAMQHGYRAGVSRNDGEKDFLCEAHGAPQAALERTPSRTPDRRKTRGS